MGEKKQKQVETEKAMYWIVCDPNMYIYTAKIQFDKWKQSLYIVQNRVKYDHSYFKKFNG